MVAGPFIQNCNCLSMQSLERQSKSLNALKCSSFELRYSKWKPLNDSSARLLALYFAIASTRFVVKPKGGSPMYFWLFLTIFWGVNESLGVERHQRGGGGVNPPPSDRSSTGCSYNNVLLPVWDFLFWYFGPWWTLIFWAPLNSI